MKIKKIAALSLSAIMGFGILTNGAAAATIDKSSEISKGAENNNRYLGDISYDKYMEFTGLKGNIPGADETVLKNLYSQIQELRKKVPYSKENYNKFNLKWDEFDEVIKKYYVEPERQYIALDEILVACGMKKDISDQDYKSLKEVYTEICTLDKAGKAKEADMKWKDFYKIYNKYIPKVFEGSNT